MNLQRFIIYSNYPDYSLKPFLYLFFWIHTCSKFPTVCFVHHKKDVYYMGRGCAHVHTECGGRWKMFSEAVVKWGLSQMFISLFLTTYLPSFLAWGRFAVLFKSYLDLFWIWFHLFLFLLTFKMPICSHFIQIGVFHIGVSWVTK